MTNKLEWNDINLNRKLMLTQSDWTQLPDSGLSYACILEWREWRSRVRKVTKKEIPERLKAITVLDSLKERIPKKEYSDEPVHFHQEGAIISKIDVKSHVLKALSELNIPIAPETPVEAPVEEPMDWGTDIKSARKHAQIELEKVYTRKIGEKTPPPETLLLYMERLNQAIDCLAKKGKTFPLLDILAEGLEQTTEEMATTVLRNHVNRLSGFGMLEKQYLEAMKSVKEADTIDDIVEILAGFSRGH
jgi:hypothetical protein